MWSCNWREPVLLATLTLVLPCASARAVPHNGASSSEAPHPCPSCWSPGNHGCAFLQIEVGRSSWPRDQPYLTLVPTVTLMTPADSKLDQNRCGVRMFKECKD